MSDLFTAAKILEISKDIVGKKGPVGIDTGIYKHNLLFEDKDKKCDVYMLGEDGNEITIDQMVALFSMLDDLVDKLMSKTWRSYYFEGMVQLSDNEFYICWGS